MQLDPTALDYPALYKLMTGLVVPRPIAWVATLSASGHANLAPFSYFTVACAHPPTLLFCPNRRLNGAKKDTLLNIEQRPEFVIHIVSAPLAAQMNQTSADYPPEVDECALVGLETVPASAISVPRIASAPAAFECRLSQIISVGDGEIVLGEAVAIHLRDEIYRDGYVILEELDPVGRLAGNSYLRCTDTFKLRRPMLASDATP
jgi:flavin reductase (DIM6/NTAB) family NADH-FMN oxidoreductase RutF